MDSALTGILLISVEPPMLSYEQEAVGFNKPNT